MRATHQINNQKISKSVSDDASLLTTDRLGGYLWIGQNHLASRYQGWFINLGGEMYKIIDEIRIEGIEKAPKLRNLWFGDDIQDAKNYLECSKNNTKAMFYLAKKSNSLILKLSQVCEVNLFLDIRKSYSSIQWGRDYRIYQKDRFVIVKYHDPESPQIIFLAISSASFYGYHQKGAWIEKRYSWDERRQSPPYQMYIYHALSLKSDEFVFGVGFSEEEAIKNANSCELSVDANMRIDANGTNENRETDFAYRLAELSLQNLLVYGKDDNVLGLYAGLPWFFQFWIRDEAISLKALSETDKQAAQDIYKNRLILLNKKDFIPTFVDFLDKTEGKSIDGFQWLYYRFLEGISHLQIKDYKLELKMLINGLDDFIKHYIDEEGLVKSSFLSWMDSIQRSQFPLESHALQLRIYRLAHKLTGNIKYHDLEKSLREKVRHYFWNGKILADGKKDFIIRPNLFLAYYIYPQLLSKDEWLTCFTNGLKVLWLKWGGISTLDRKAPNFVAIDTGEDSQSYHQGNSWFWVNNIAAIAMLRLNREKFLPKIKKILSASTKNILWYGSALGYASELSSAEKFFPAGSVTQTWSAATYIELYLELSRGSAGGEVKLKI